MLRLRKMIIRVTWMIACPIMLSQATLCWASLSLGRRPLPGYWWWPPAPSPGKAEHTDETELFSDSLLAQLYLLQLSSSPHDVTIDKTVKTSQRLHFRQNYFILSNYVDVIEHLYFNFCNSKFFLLLNLTLLMWTFSRWWKCLRESLMRVSSNRFQAFEQDPPDEYK